MRQLCCYRHGFRPGGWVLSQRVERKRLDRCGPFATMVTAAMKLAMMPAIERYRELIADDRALGVLVDL